MYRLLGKAELPVDDLIIRKGTQIDFSVNLRDGDNIPIEVHHTKSLAKRHGGFINDKTGIAHFSYYFG